MSILNQQLRAMAEFPLPPAVEQRRVTLEDLVLDSGKLSEELRILINAAARIDDALSGNTMVEGNDNAAQPAPAGMLYRLHENFGELAQKIGALRSILNRIEDRLHSPKATPVGYAFPPPPPPGGIPIAGRVVDGGYQR